MDVMLNVFSHLYLGEGGLEEHIAQAALCATSSTEHVQSVIKELIGLLASDKREVGNNFSFVQEQLNCYSKVNMRRA